MGSSAELNLFAPDDHDDYDMTNGDMTNGDERSHNMKLSLKVWNPFSSAFAEKTDGGLVTMIKIILP